MLSTEKMLAIHREKSMLFFGSIQAFRAGSMCNFRVWHHSVSTISPVHWERCRGMNFGLLHNPSGAFMTTLALKLGWPGCLCRCSSAWELFVSLSIHLVCKHSLGPALARHDPYKNHKSDGNSEKVSLNQNGKVQESFWRKQWRNIKPSFIICKMGKTDPLWKVTVMLNELIVQKWVNIWTQVWCLIKCPNIFVC